jgi:hypothetical protein
MFRGAVEAGEDLQRRGYEGGGMITYHSIREILTPEDTKLGEALVAVLT